jgi:hypothetical protein
VWTGVSTTRDIANSGIKSPDVPNASASRWHSQRSLNNEWAAFGLHGECVSCKLLERKERETGIEPATSSLGNWASIESKEQSRVSASTISIKTAVIFTFRIRVQPNGLQLGCTITMRIRFLVLITQRSEVQIVPRNQGREQAALFIALATTDFGSFPRFDPLTTRSDVLSEHKNLFFAPHHFDQFVDIDAIETNDGSTRHAASDMPAFFEEQRHCRLSDAISA